MCRRKFVNLIFFSSIKDGTIKTMISISTHFTTFLMNIQSRKIRDFHWIPMESSINTTLSLFIESIYAKPMTIVLSFKIFIIVPTTYGEKVRISFHVQLNFFISSTLTLSVSCGIKWLSLSMGSRIMLSIDGVSKLEITMAICRETRGAIETIERRVMKLQTTWAVGASLNHSINYSIPKPPVFVTHRAYRIVIYVSFKLQAQLTYTHHYSFG